MSEYINRQTAYDAIRNAFNMEPSKQARLEATLDATYVDGFNDGYHEGWEEGQEALRREMWEREREQFDQQTGGY